MPDLLSSSTTNSCDDPRTTLVALCTAIRRPRPLTGTTGGGGGSGGGGYIPNPEDLVAKALEHVWDVLSDQIQTLKAENRSMQEKMDAMQGSFARELAAARKVGERQR